MAPAEYNVITTVTLSTSLISTSLEASYIWIVMEDQVIYKGNVQIRNVNATYGTSYCDHKELT